MLVKCREVSNAKSLPIREVATLVGLMVSSFPASDHGELFYRHLESGRTNAVKQNDGNFEANMTISESSGSDILWWIENLSVTQ